MLKDSWFKDVFGFEEKGSYKQRQKMFHVSDDGTILTTTVVQPSTTTTTTNEGDSRQQQGQRQFYIGNFATPSVAELRQEISSLESKTTTTTTVNDDDDTIGGSTSTTSAAGAAGGNINDDGQQQQQQQQRLLRFQHVVGDVGLLHRLPENEGAVFQAASQFNCLEMTSPNIKPDKGVTGYVHDRTQGPVCALACPSATIFRNYFANGKSNGNGGDGNNTNVEELVGQGGKDGIQINLLKDIGDFVGNNDDNGSSSSPSTATIAAAAGSNPKPKYWKMKNGYALPTNKTSMKELSTKLHANAPQILIDIISKLRVGVQWDTEVSYIGYEHLIRSSSSSNSTFDSVLPNPPHHVCQVYCSALPIAYDYGTPTKDWEIFARTILMGLYEATIAVGVVKHLQQQDQQDQKLYNRIKIYLTMVGGGAFGNESKWIAEAIQNTLKKYQQYPLDVYLVHYGRIDNYYVKNIQY